MYYIFCVGVTILIKLGLISISKIVTIERSSISFTFWAVFMKNSALYSGLIQGKLEIGVRVKIIAYL